MVVLNDATAPSEGGFPTVNIGRYDIVVVFVLGEIILV
jgi:hypothetical protein